ncbi:MAG: phosphoribosylformylglycinamidine synthase I [Deltaproteobacteria bacterium]|nr:MAG: phosphoribosylformylglycinamidine synthase I [Deltaproteobacteria bacterium]
MNKVKALILTGFGLNCDEETAHAFEMAGAKADKIHINDLVNGDISIHDYKILAFGGGFSWGDEHGAGVLQAIRMKTHLGNELAEFVEKDNLIIGICNGFQTLVNIGLLPGFSLGSYEREVALIHNDGNFIDDWVNLKVEKSNCVFTRGIDFMELPVRHGEGKFYAEPEILDKLEEKKQIALRYCKKDGALAEGSSPSNPNGSFMDIAGICDSTGRVFGLMPHPEAFVHWSHHPMWTLMDHKMKKAGEDLFSSSLPHGLNIFKNAVEYFC